MTEDQKAQTAQQMAETMDAMDALVEMASGLKNKLEAAGFHPSIAQMMASHWFDHLIDRMFDDKSEKR